LADGAGQVPHAVGLHPECEIQRIGGNVLEVVGPILVGRAIHVGGTCLLQRPEEILVVILGAVVHQVLEEMSEPGPSRFLVLRPDMVPDVDRDDRRLSILVHDERQTVGEYEALKGDIDRGLTGGSGGLGNKSYGGGGRRMESHGHGKNAS
jgi:hypothetical protein